ncbi:MAG: PspC domain-containing protein [Chlamydiia bacterium]|nr:PspC domain-containing protein [Chlamydiia bacterium]
MQFECRRLYRSVRERKIAGICGGIAEGLKIDATIVRIVMLFAMLLTGFFPLLIAYIIGIVIIPERPDEHP